MTFAQVDPLSNWLQVVIQGGSFALLTVTIIYLAPKVIAAAIRYLEQRDTKFTEALDKLQEKNDDRNAALVSGSAYSNGYHRSNWTRDSRRPCRWRR